MVACAASSANLLACNSRSISLFLCTWAETFILLKSWQWLALWDIGEGCLVLFLCSRIQTDVCLLPLYPILPPEWDAVESDEKLNSVAVSWQAILLLHYLALGRKRGDRGFFYMQPVIRDVSSSKIINSCVSPVPFVCMLWLVTSCVNCWTSEFLLLWYVPLSIMVVKIKLSETFLTAILCLNCGQ